MLEGGTDGTLLCSGGDFEAISGCGAPLSAPRQKLRGACAIVRCGVGAKNMHGHVHKLLLNITYYY